MWTAGKARSYHGESECTVCVDAMHDGEFREREGLGKFVSLQTMHVPPLYREAIERVMADLAATLAERLNEREQMARLDEVGRFAHEQAEWEREQLDAATDWEDYLDERGPRD